MSPFNAIQLPGWTVTGIADLAASSGPLVFTAAPGTTATRIRCEDCGAPDELRRHGKMTLTLTDAPAFGRRVRIKVEKQRFKCRCGWTGCPEVPDVAVRYRLTARCVSYVLERAAFYPFSHVAREVGLSDTTVRELTTAAWGDVPRYEFDTPRYLGIDELILRDKRSKEDRGPIKRAVFVDLEAGRVLDILPDNKGRSVMGWLARLPNRHRIRIVTTDFEASYRDAVRLLLPDAHLIIDKWHAMKGVWDALDHVRVAALRKRGQKVFNDTETRRIANILRANNIAVTDKRWILLDGFLRQHEDVRIAHEIKEDFSLIWASAERPDMAAFHLLRWFDLVEGQPQRIRQHFEPVVRLLRRNMGDVLRYFEWPLTNSPTEAMNRSIRRINGAGQGLGFEALRYRARAYSRAKVPRIFFCDRCLKRTSIKHKIELPAMADKIGHLVHGDTFYLCEGCRHFTALASQAFQHVFAQAVDADAQRVLRDTWVHQMPQTPRFASVEERRALRSWRTRKAAIDADGVGLLL